MQTWGDIKKEIVPTLFRNQLEKKKISQYQVIKYGIRVERLPGDVSCRKGYFSWFTRVLKEACGMPREKWRLGQALHCSPSASLMLVCLGGGGVYSEVERLLTRLIMGTDLPVVTLFNDMLLGSAPCWGCDSSAAGAAWWIAAGSWRCNHSPAVTAWPRLSPSPRTGRPGLPTPGRQEGGPEPSTFLCRAWLNVLGCFFPPKKNTLSPLLA